jgi:hypothetical protein
MTNQYRFLTFVMASTFMLAATASWALALDYTASVLPAPGYYLGAQASSIAGVNVVGNGSGITSDVLYHTSDALLWSAPNNNPISLNPGPNFRSIAYGASSDSQVGTAANDVFFNDHAALWHSTAASFVDLNPADFYTSEAYAVSGNNQVGGGGPNSIASTGGAGHALLWHGTAESVVDINPAGYVGSVALNVEGENIVGSAIDFDTNRVNAVLWTGPTHTVANLHPAGFTSSFASAVSGNSQVGTAYMGIQFGEAPHALLWHGSAATAVDLNPAGFLASEVYGVAGNLQVGYGFGDATGGANHALLWQGTAASVIDLHSLLVGLIPDLVGSIAHDVDANGTIVGFAIDANNVNYAVQWTPVNVPEPSVLLLAALGGVALIAAPRQQRADHRSRKVRPPVLGQTVELVLAPVPAR